MTITVILSFVVTMIISAFLIPIITKAGTSLNIVAHKNARTVHKTEIVRIGGYAIYLSSLAGTVIFLKTDPQINAILISGFFIFIVGLYDDIHDLSPKIKLLVELVAAFIVIYFGDIYIKGFDVFPAPYGTLFSGLVTLLWIVGITNAINLIDGLDGLSAGISIIVLFTISMTSLLSGRTDIASLSLVLAGAIMGFLFYNFHPAKIFMGDSGALYIGFMISVISLLGFGYSASAFFTLGAPIVVLMVPIMDTLIAIIRRKLHHKKFSDADRLHLHHNLMFKLNLGQRKSVLVLYAITFLFSLTSYVYYFDARLGIFMFIALMLVFEIFVELTNMISRKYKPVLTIINIFLGNEHLPKIKVLDTYQKNRSLKQKRRDQGLIVLALLCLFCGVTYYFVSQGQIISNEVTEKQTPYLNNSDKDILNNIYTRLDRAYQSDEDSEESQLVAAYFVCDYFTLDDKEDSIGGLDYIYPELQDSFSEYAKTSFYARENKDIEVLSYNIISYSPSKVVVDDLEDNDYYSVLIELTWNEELEDYTNTVQVSVVQVDDRYYVCGIDQA